MDKYEFDSTADSWALNRDIIIEIDEVLWLLAPELHNPYRRVLRYYAENQSAAYCRVIHWLVRKFLEAMETQEFAVTSLRNYRASLSPTNEWRLGHITAFLQRWHDHGYPGVTDEAAEWLKRTKLKGNSKGDAVRSMDPIAGPFDDQELSDILDTAAQLYELDRIDLVTLSFTLLLSLSGRRPVQLRLLRTGDLMQTMTTDGRPIDIVRIPRAKQRGQAPRTEFKNFWVRRDVWLVLTAQREAVIEKAQARLGQLPGNLTAELPLFPDWKLFNEIRSINELRAALVNDSLHVRGHKIQSGLNKIRVVSDRTGKQVHITPSRFRYTLGTRAGREGFGAMVIAELLDHSDVQNVGVYTRDHPNFRQTIDDAVGKQMAPVAAAYAARLVDKESDARFGNDPAMRVGTRTDSVGTCGSAGACRAGAVACYTCIHFQPWLTGPHKKMVKEMEDEQRRLREAGASEMVVRVTDRNIRAARAVEAACNARKATLGMAHYE